MDTEASAPDFLNVLKARPGTGAVLDIVSDPFQTMYHQTVHEKPLVFGLLSRTPYSVAVKDEELKQLIGRGEYRRLHDEYRIRYLVTSAGTDIPFRTIFEDSNVKLYELGR